jgi:hypothetical protein
VDPETTACVTPPRPIIACKSSDGTQKNQMCSDEGPLTLERSKTVDEEISAKKAANESGRPFLSQRRHKERARDRSPWVSRAPAVGGKTATSNETIFQNSRNRPAMGIGSYDPDQTRGAIMLAAIINSIYREFVRSSLSGAKIAGG